MPTPTAVSIPGKGWDLQVSINTSYTSIPGVVSIDGPDASCGTREVTTLLSTAREFSGTIPDYGSVTANLMYDNTNAVQVTLLSLLAANPSTGNLFKLISPTTTKAATFNGVVTGFPLSGISVDGTVMAALKIKVNGPLTYPAT